MSDRADQRTSSYGYSPGGRQFSRIRQAEQALREGACVIVYPEGTGTRDPDLWPMVGRDQAGDPARVDAGVTFSQTRVVRPLMRVPRSVGMISWK